MIRVVLYKDGNGRLTGFSADGHSGYAEEGSDIVCAAVSALTITCVNSLESICGVTPRISGGEDGHLKAMLPKIRDEQQEHDAQILMRALQQGLQDMAESYSDYIRLSIKDGGKHNDEA